MLETVLFGSYTRKSGKGIYRSQFDSEKGILSSPKPYITSIGSPTYSAVSSDNYLYSVDQELDKGGIAVFDLNEYSPKLVGKFLNNDPAPCYVFVDEKLNFVYTGVYQTGRISVYRISKDHTLILTDEVAHHGKGTLSRQECAHVHFTNLTPDHRLLAADLGTNQLYVYRITDAGKLEQPVISSLPDGFGPRHLVFNKIYSIAYLLGELSNQVAVLFYDHSSGKFDLGHVYSTIPENYPAVSGAAAIRISNDSRFLYTSNRGYDTINVFRIEDHGTSLSLLQTISTEGRTPRDFDLDISQKWLLAVNQDSDNGAIFIRNPDDGRLTLKGKNIYLPEGVNVNFIIGKLSH